MRLNKRKLRRLIESEMIAQVKAANLEKNKEHKVGNIADLMLLLTREPRQELASMHPGYLAYAAVVHADTLMHVYNRASKGGENQLAGLNAVYQRLRELARNHEGI